MYIKGITIHGFKSFKNKTVVESFDPGFNIIVGRNGSGKSNLFAAIEFALTLEYRHLGAVEKSKLLYDGRSTNDPAYVEIVFDNTDGKLPVESTTVTFMRMLSAKKDKFFCNGSEIPNAKRFLDAAGFTNPYFIVKQGKVNQLSLAKDEFRLKMLQDVTGSSSHDNKIQECRKSIISANAKKVEAEKLLAELDERRQSLKDESEELENFLQLDVERRLIEHILNEREQNAAKLGIAACEDERDKLGSELEPMQQAVAETQRRQFKLKDVISKKEAEIQDVNVNKGIIDADILKLIEEKEKLNNNKNDVRNQLKELASISKNDRLEKLNKDLKEERKNLMKAEKHLEIAAREEENVHKKLTEEDSKLKTLDAQLKGATEFQGFKERNAWLSDISRQISTKAKSLKESETEFEKLEEKKLQVSNDLETGRKELLCIRHDILMLQKASNLPDLDLFHRKKSRDNHWNTLNDIDRKLEHEKSVRHTIMEHLCKRVGREVINGWEGITKILQELKDKNEEATVQGYHGLVIENLNCDEGLTVAVEAAAGSKLFFHIVDNHAVSRRLLYEFNVQKMKGSPYFIPIDKIETPKITYPPSSLIFCPLLDKLQHPEELEKVFRHIFGTTLLCRELSDATSLAKLHKINCVTTEGDKVSRAGPITGGYRQAQLGLLELQRNKSASDEKSAALSLQKIEVENELKKLDEFITKANMDKEHRVSQLLRLTTKMEELERKMKCFDELLKSTITSSLNLKKEVDRKKRDLYELQCRKSTYEGQVKSNSNRNTSQEDRTLVNQLKKTVKKLVEKENIAVLNKIAQDKVVKSIHQKVHNIQTMIEEESCRQLNSNSSEEQKQQLQNLNEMIEIVGLHIEAKQKEVQNVCECLPKLNKKLHQEKEKLEKLYEVEREQRSKMFSVEKKLQQQVTILIGHQKKLQTALEAAMLLGTIPKGAEKFRNVQSKSLYSRLKKLAKRITSAGPVNQKAAEQYAEINENYEKFENKLEQLEEGRSELSNLIRDLEAKKSEAILKNFRVLQDQFSQIFSAIVPRGRAELVLYGKDFEVYGDTRDTRLGGLTRSDDAEGIRINVSFTSKSLPKTQELNVLSGGQKSVVALCLILAIQKIDPVPFYLLDEVDQALDPEYRAAVRKVIHGLTTQFKLQFICTTFRREFLVDADKCFGVSCSNKISTVRPISQDEARDFVESDTSGESGSSSAEAEDSDSVQQEDNPEPDTQSSQDSISNDVDTDSSPAESDNSGTSSRVM